MSLYKHALQRARELLPPDGHDYYVYRTCDTQGPATLIRALAYQVGADTAQCQRRARRAIVAALRERKARAYGDSGEVYLGRDAEPGSVLI